MEDVLPAAGSPLIDVHLRAMDHHVGDFELGQVEKAAEHVGVVLHDRAFLLEKVDSATQFLIGRKDRLVLADANRRTAAERRA